MINNDNLGICLSGGGTRGAVHIGVLKALEENEISPTFISGSSAGSLIGALYAYGHTPNIIWSIIKETKILSLLKLRFGTGLLDLSKINKALSQIFANDSFDDFVRKLYICVSNINTGKWEIIDQGELFNVIHASCAVPIIFKPVKIGAHHYCDGGLLNNLPIEPLKNRCDRVIGVNLIPITTKKPITGFIEMAMRTSELTLGSNSNYNRSQCDVLIEIDELSGYAMHDLKKMEEMYDLGYRYTMSNISMIKAQLE